MIKPKDVAPFYQNNRIKSVKDFLREFVFGPARSGYRQITGNAIHLCRKVSNFIYKKSDETALMLAMLNFVSSFTSHWAQINGLKKSDRENKDYLIKQEKIERNIDIVLSIVPPIALNYFLKTKLYSGKWTTKSALNEWVNTAGPVAGLSRDELFNIDSFRSPKEVIAQSIDDLISYINKKYENLPSAIREKSQSFSSFLHKNYIKERKFDFPSPSLKEIALEEIPRFKKTPFDNYYNGNAYDELCGQIEGMMLIVSLAYTLLSNSIVTPILKNIFANRSYKKELAKKGETPESFVRKERFKNLEYLQTSDELNLFNFSDITSNSINIHSKPLKKQSDIFDNFSDYNKYLYKRGNLRI